MTQYPRAWRGGSWRDRLSLQSFRLRIALLSVGLAGTAVVGFGVTAWFLIREANIQELGETLKAQLLQEGMIARPPNDWETYEQSSAALFDADEADSIALKVIDANGTVYQSEHWPVGISLPEIAKDLPAPRPIPKANDALPVLGPALTDSGPLDSKLLLPAPNREIAPLATPASPTSSPDSSLPFTAPQDSPLPQLPFEQPSAPQLPLLESPPLDIDFNLDGHTTSNITPRSTSLSGQTSQVGTLQEQEAIDTILRAVDLGTQRQGESSMSHGTLTIDIPSANPKFSSPAARTRSDDGGTRNGANGAPAPSGAPPTAPASSDGPSHSGLDNSRPDNSRLDNRNRKGPGANPAREEGSNRGGGSDTGRSNSGESQNNDSRGGGSRGSGSRGGGSRGGSRGGGSGGGGKGGGRGGGRGGGHSNLPVTGILAQIQTNTLLFPQLFLAQARERTPPQTSVSQKPQLQRHREISDDRWPVDQWPEELWLVGTLNQSGQQVAIALNLEILDHTLAPIRNIGLLMIPVILLFVALGAWFIAGQALQPLYRVNASIRQITAQGLSQRLSQRETDGELADLIQAFNQMLGRLERSFMQASRFSADAAHELKTPLAVLQGQLERALHQAETESPLQRHLGQMLEEVSHLGGILRKLLLLSLADAGRMQLTFENMNLSDLLKDLVEDLDLLAPSLKIHTAIEPGLVVRADRDLLQQVLQNLTTNAVKYNMPNGWVRLEAQQSNTQIRVIVSNCSEDLPLAVRNRLFERFYRADSARSSKVEGVGLGLSLSREIAWAHRGDLCLAEPKLGETEFVLTLPYE